MSEILHTDRIIQLIELNHNDSEILKIIHEEYNIYLSIDAVQKKRNSKNLNDFNQSNIQSLQKKTNLILEEKADLIREILEDIYYVPLTKREIINKIYENHKIIISQSDAKEILWNLLKSKIIYDRNDWTYKPKTKVIPNVKNRSYIKDSAEFDEVIQGNNKDINNLLVELNNPINSINLILESTKNSKVINDNEKVYNNLEKLIVETKKIEYLVKNKFPEINNNENKNQIVNMNNYNTFELDVFSNILKEEKYRLGSPVVNQFVENVTKRIKDLT